MITAAAAGAPPDRRRESGGLLPSFDRYVLLATGRAVRIRPSQPDDSDSLRRFYESLSDRSMQFRFFGDRPAQLYAGREPLRENDIYHHVMLLAFDDAGIAGVGEYWRIAGRPEAEVAFAVADAHQHQGIATVLLEDLAMIARSAGLQRLVAETLADNEAMRLVFRTVGLAERSWFDDRQVHVELDLCGDDLLEDAADGRDWVAAVASLRPLLSPSHVVVIGAGRDPSSPGRIVLANLRASFGGRISVVHPRARVVDEQHTEARVTDLATVPDLAVVAVPAAQVPSVVEECGRAGVAAVVVISAGFAETGIEGVELQQRLLDCARRHGMRVVGPNCLGVVASAAGLNATFMRQRLASGSIAVASQSGGVGVVLATEASRRKLGISSFVSLGNKADVSGNDLLRYWADDPATSVVLMYLESIGDPRRFARIARAVSKRVPVVALKSGRSDAGRRGARSHTAALATDDVAVDALFSYTGVIRADTLDQLLDIGVLLASQPAPSGRRVALVGNAGGPLIVAADAAATNGLQVVELSAALQRRLRAIVPNAASTNNPVDLLATATAASVEAVLEELAGSGEVDACAVVTVKLDGDAPSSPRFDWHHATVPAIAVRLGDPAATGSIPVFPTPERAMDALGRAAGRGDWLSTAAEEHVSDAGIDLMSVRRSVRRAADSIGGTGWLPPAETFRILEELGIPLTPWAIGGTGRACAEHARRIGFPCVLKADVAGLVHKSDEGAVVLGVMSCTAVRRHVADFRRRFGDRLRHVVIQRQAEPGVELLVGAVRDPAVGPLVAVAAGGVAAEVLGDRTVLMAPISESRARWAVERLRTYPLLRGFRGRPVIPVEPVVDAVRRIGLLVAVAPEISELDVNPLIAGPHGSMVVDARIAVAPYAVNPVRALRAQR